MSVIDKKTKAILWGTGILVTLMIVLTIYSTISGKYEIGGNFAAGVLVLVIGGSIIAGVIYYIIGMIKLNEKKKYVSQEKVVRLKPLPIYSRGMYWGCIVFYVVLTALFVFDFEKFYTKYFIIYLILSLIGAILFYITFRQNKMLYLYKDNSKVMNYNDKIDDAWEIFELHTYVSSHNGDHLVKKKCEQIELYNNIKFWSCFTKEISHSTSSDGTDSTYYYSFIFSIAHYDNEQNIDIVLNNRASTYLNKENIYIPRFSNIPPFLITGELSENICRSIEDICSSFFAKTRSKYILIIRNGTIGLGLKSARFGKYNRIFNKNKAVQLTDEAINEIADFLTQIKCVIERYQ